MPQGVDENFMFGATRPWRDEEIKTTLKNKYWADAAKRKHAFQLEFIIKKRKTLVAEITSIDSSLLRLTTAAPLQIMKFSAFSLRTVIFIENYKWKKN